MNPCVGFGRVLRVLRVLRALRGLGGLLVLSASLCAAQNMKDTTQFWWPDPATGLMWSGWPVGGSGLHWAEADKACSLASIDGYTGWRLPSKDEYQAITWVRDEGEATDPGGFKEGRELKIGQPTGLFWSGTPGAVPGDHWALFYPLVGPVSKNDASHLQFETMCVRTMEPELLALAKEAHPPVAISGMDEMNHFLWLARAEDATNALKFDEAVADIQKALVLAPESGPAYDALAKDYEYMGRWADAVASWKKAQKLDHESKIMRADDYKRVAKLQKLAATDPNTVAGHVLTLKASVAMSQARYPDAIAAANELIALEPKWGEGYQYLGQTYARMERWDDAATALTTASKLNKDVAGAVKTDLKWVKQQQKWERKPQAGA